ncbi:transglycosylase SLT domain-containing protein [Paracidovorax citrulli]
MRSLLLKGLIGAACLFSGVLAAQQKPGTTSAPAASDAASVRTLSLANKPWTGDFDAMLERRVIRVLVPYSRSLYFSDKGRELGITAELVRDFERYLNKVHASRLGKRPLTIIMIPTTRDRLLPDINAGLGDIAAGNLTVTDERLKLVDFVAPRDRKAVRELVVTGSKSEAIASPDDLSGKTVHVRRASSYYESLTRLNDNLRRAGKAPARLVLLPDALEDEDVLEMVNAGLLSIVVMDDWKAAMWAQILPNIKVRTDLVLREEGYTGWALRKNSPQLRGAVEDFYVNFLKKSSVAEVRLKQHMARVKQIGNNTGDAEYKRFKEIAAFFEKYGKDYRFDPLMLAAQGFQESQLDQKVRSRVGAVGIMQIMPATGKELNVGDINVAESNIHAGAKYMDQLMSRYFPDARFSEQDRPLFAFASYNAGPANIAKMRKEAAARGLDPDKWFNNVEIVVAEKIGIETTTYVRNIFKYYAAYRLIRQMEEVRERAVKEVKK